MELKVGDSSVHIAAGESWIQNRELRRSLAMLSKRANATGSSGEIGSQGSGLSPTVKRQIGLAVGIPLGAILLIALGLFFLWKRNRAPSRPVERIYDARSEKRRSKRKSRAGTASSSQTFHNTPQMDHSFPSPTSGDELTALPPIITRSKTPDRPHTSHTILGDLALRPSIRSLTRKVSGTFKHKRDDDPEAGAISRNNSAASTRGGRVTPTRHPSQRELYYQNMREAEAKGTLPERTASPLPPHLGSAIVRSSSPAAASVLGEPDMQRPQSPNFYVTTELARHDAHMSLLEERRAIAERYAELIDQRAKGSSPPPRGGTPRSPSAPGMRQREQTGEETLPGGFVIPENSRTHTRKPSRQNAAQQAYQAQYYENPTGTAAPTESHNLGPSSPSPFGQQLYRGYSPVQPRSSPSPNPYSRDETPPIGARSGGSHSRGRSNPVYSPRDIGDSHRRARSQEQSGGSVRAALNELRQQSNEPGQGPLDRIPRTPSAGRRRDGKSPSEFR
jgi:hypothetical protein